MTEQVLTVKTELTPNPNSLKYNVGKSILPGGGANFPTQESAMRSPLATRLFKVKGINSVFIGSDFITITKEEAIDWQTINEGVAPALEDFFESGDATLEGESAVADMEIGADSEDPEVVNKIKQLIDEKVRPAVAQDGGDIVYRGLADGVVYLEMLGACNGCPSAGATLKDGVEKMLMHYMPDEIKEVRAIS